MPDMLLRGVNITQHYCTEIRGEEALVLAFQTRIALPLTSPVTYGSDLSPPTDSAFHNHFSLVLISFDGAQGFSKGVLAPPSGGITWTFAGCILAVRITCKRETLRT